MDVWILVSLGEYLRTHLKDHTKYDQGPEIHGETRRVLKFKYLGSTVQESGSCEREVKKRVQAGGNRWRKLLGVICDRKLPARVKIKVYSSGLIPAMVYGFEMVAVTKKQVQQIEVAKMKMLRFAIGVTRKDKIRNAYIRGTVKVE